MQDLLARPSRRRGLAGQRPHRRAERIARRSAVACLRWLTRRGRTLEDTAARLGLDRTTLSEWSARWSADRLELAPLGRTPAHLDGERRRELLAVFGLMGVHVGLNTLRGLFPDCPRNELHELIARCRSAVRRQGATTIHALHWQRTGAVWAIDGKTAPTPVDGTYPVVLVVRDLASGFTLASMPAAAEDGESLAALLEALFLEHSAPLVLKSDNRACHTDVIEQLLARWHVLLLASPPHTPRYNGAIEAGIGALAVEAHWLAARNDHPGEWTCNDLEGARLKANETHRPWGALAASPDYAWAARKPLADDERCALLWTVWQYRDDERNTRGLLPGVPAPPAEEADIQRIALGRALIDRGYLTIRRRRFTPPISRAYLRNIS